jgi:hypothetical protein
MAAGFPQSFLDRILYEPIFGCWLWIGVLDRDGYGRFSVGNARWKLAHRVAFALVRGYEPKSLDHRCRVRCCVNPEHLEDVNTRTNVLRGEGLCAKNARKTHCPHGHPLVAGNLVGWFERRGWRACLTCNRAHSRRHQWKGWREKSSLVS